MAEHALSKLVILSGYCICCNYDLFERGAHTQTHPTHKCVTNAEPTIDSPRRCARLRENSCQSMSSTILVCTVSFEYVERPPEIDCRHCHALRSSTACTRSRMSVLPLSTWLITAGTRRLRCHDAPDSRKVDAMDGCVLHKYARGGV